MSSAFSFRSGVCSDCQVTFRHMGKEILHNLWYGFIRSYFKLNYEPAKSSVGISPKLIVWLMIVYHL